MRQLEVVIKKDGTVEYPNGNRAGTAGEHNMTQLVVTLSEDLISDKIDCYILEFKTAYAQRILSQKLQASSGKLSITLWQQLMVAGSLTVQVNAYDSDGSLIEMLGKSPVIELNVEQSIIGGSAESDTQFHGMIAEIYELENKINETISESTAATTNANAAVDELKANEKLFVKSESPALTGTPTAPTAAAGTSTTQIATTAFAYTAADAVDTKLAGHVGRTDNPHGVTKVQIGLGNVDNTADADKPVSKAMQTAIDAKANQTTTYMKAEVDNAISQVVSNLDWKESVATFLDIAVTYPSPADGWTVNVRDTDMTYRYSGSAWVAISANSIPLATSSVDGKMSKTDKAKLDGIEAGATADMTASEILTAVKTVDGPSSGLDADTLDGADSSAFAKLASPALTGTPTAPTAAANTNTAQIATTGFVIGQAAALEPTALGAAYVGSSVKYAREDHVHALPAVATSSSDGLMSKTDKAKLDGIADKSGNVVTLNGYGTDNGPDSVLLSGRNPGTKIGANSVAEGTCTTASGDCSHSEGMCSEARGTCSHAEGGATAIGDFSHAEGGATADAAYMHAMGQFNKLSSTLAAHFVIGNGTSDTALANIFRVDPSGSTYGVGAFNTSGADYAEYFEWQDENPNNEDRAGHFVTLDGEKIKYANDGDYVVGIVSGAPAIVGDHPSESWAERYMKDIFGRIQYHSVNVPEQTETVTKADGTTETIVIRPAHTEVQPVVNPNYDPTKEDTYQNRESRPEWAAVGMVGKLICIDDGTCEVNGYCKPQNGVATKADSGYRVISRPDSTHIKVLIK